MLSRKLVAGLALVVGASACSKPQPPTITPKSAQVSALSTTGVQLTVSFDVTNPNGFPLIVHAVDGRFSIGAGAGTELGQAHAEPSASIPAKGTSTVSSQLSVTWTNLSALIPFAISPAAVPYRFDGTAQLGGESLNVNVPFELTGELTRAQLLGVGLVGLTQPAPH